MNAYAAYVKAKVDDPATPSAEYVRYWNEWNSIVREQNIVTNMAEKRCREALRTSLVGHAGRVASAVGICAA